VRDLGRDCCRRLLFIWLVLGSQVAAGCSLHDSVVGLLRLAVLRHAGLCLFMRVSEAVRNLGRRGGGSVATLRAWWSDKEVEVSERSDDCSVCSYLSFDLQSTLRTCSVRLEGRESANPSGAVACFAAGSLGPRRYVGTEPSDPPVGNGR